jgi:hypothetical protein
LCIAIALALAAHERTGFSPFLGCSFHGVRQKDQCQGQQLQQCVVSCAVTHSLALSWSCSPGSQDVSEQPLCHGDAEANSITYDFPEESVEK